MKRVNPFLDSELKIGILGGGQLGKMYCEAAQPWNLNIWILDTSKDFPAGPGSSNFIEGDFTDYDDVLNFGRLVDVITVEIEKVNVDALEVLESEGKIVHPCASVLRTIRDKGLQKQFYQKNELPTAPFILLDSKEEILKAVDEGSIVYPFVQKARRDGYDGRGVAVIRGAEESEKIIDTESVIEPLIDIDKELAVIIARNERGELKSFPPVAMAFHDEANLVDYLYSPSGVGTALEMEAIQVAQTVAETLDVGGLLAVELFLTTNGEILINEVAPRPHNSGHHTIESCSSSQYEMGLLAICGMTLPDINEISPAVMVNLVGHEGNTGSAVYEGIEEAISMGNVHVHLYGKKITKPFRKMGHATILDISLEAAIEKATFVRDLIKVKA